MWLSLFTLCTTGRRGMFPEGGAWVIADCGLSISDCASVIHDAFFVHRLHLWDASKVTVENHSRAINDYDKLIDWLKSQSSFCHHHDCVLPFKLLSVIPRSK